LDHRLLQVYEVHKDHCILYAPFGKHFKKLPYGLTQRAFNKFSFQEIAQFLETDLLGKNACPSGAHVGGFSP
jgi:hypothetical protein